MQAPRTALPPSCSDLDPYVPSPLRTWFVSDWMTEMRSIGTPRSDAASCAYAVSWPCPLELVPTPTVNDPSADARANPNSDVSWTAVIST